MSVSRFSLALAALLLSVGVMGSTAEQAAAPKTANPVLLVDTVKGQFEIELYPAEAPKAVARILELVKANFYRGLRVHHVQPGIIQFGDPATRNMQKAGEWGLGGSGKRIGVKEVSKKPFDKGAVGYAYQNGEKPEDADSQIFVLRIANPGLNGKYALLGHVTKGLDVVDKLNVADVIKNVTVKP